MKSLTNELRQVLENEPDIALLLNVFGEIERTYHETLEVMGITSKPIPEVGNSAEVTISFHPTAYSS